MAELKQNAAMIRGDQAYKNEKRLKVIKNAPHYKIEGDDILLLNGPYANSWVKELWNRGSQERDYIYKYVFATREPDIQRIVRQLFCQ